MTSAPYEFNYIPADETYAYTVTKDGYTGVSVSDFVMPANDTTVSVELALNIASTWTGPIIIALQTQISWASYNGTP